MPAGSAAHAPVPQWRQRPDFLPGALLTLQDVDLGALDGGGSSDESPAAGPGAAAAPLATLVATSGDAESAGPGSGDEGGAGVGARKRRRNFGRKTGPMSEERKAAISRALQSKGAKSEEHKR